MWPIIRAMASRRRDRAVCRSIALVKMRVTQDGVAAHHVKRERLAGQPRRGGNGDDAANPIRMARGQVNA